jgi:site-specific DNA-methyltransferase (adenine-specific)
LDPFCGSGTTPVAAVISGRNWVGIELSPNYCEIARQRVKQFVDKKKQTKLDFEEGV